MTRTFEDRKATREQVPLWIGLSSPSGAGKTYSALRLATGIARVAGGPVFCIDTEACRATHYADTFDFRHVEFGAPFSPLDYLAAIQHCVRQGAKVIIIDSMSHEHEGPGGVLEMHEAQTDRLAKQWKTSRDKVQMTAWAKPKAARRRLLNSMLQMKVNFIMCFRAKEKIKPVKGKQPLSLGWMPIAGESHVYECTTHLFIPPGADGVPNLTPERPGEKMMTMVPAQFRHLFQKPRQLDEDLGEAMAKWAAGDAPKSSPGPRFGKLKWSGASEWSGQLLANAPEEALREYRQVLVAALDDPKRKKAHSAMRKNLEEVDALLPAESAPDWGDGEAPADEPPADYPLPGDDYPEAEAV